jgi:hypothetical protein
MQGDPVAVGAVVMDALRICEANFVTGYLSQIIDVAKPGARAVEKATNAMLAGIAAMRPRDEAEAMLIAQMVAMHYRSLTSFVTHARRPPAGRDRSSARPPKTRIDFVCPWADHRARPQANGARGREVYGTPEPNIADCPVAVSMRRSGNFR